MMWNYFPQYLESLVFMSVPYVPPGPFDLGRSCLTPCNMPRYTAYLIQYFTDSRHAISGTFGYMYTINEPGSADLFSRHVRSIKQPPHCTLILVLQTESFLSLLYPEDPATWKSNLCPRGKAKEWVTADRKTGLPAWESSDERQYQIEMFRNGGWTGPTNWSVMRGHTVYEAKECADPS
jgi:soluble epoxide hydrolase / lipid-phosphate phosphatase